MHLSVVVLLAALTLTAPASAAPSLPLTEDHKAAVTGQGPERRPVEAVVTYRVGSRGDVGHDLADFDRSVAATLADPRGWSLGGAVRFAAVSRGADVRVWLATPSHVAAADRTCDARYSCRVGRDIYINRARWRYGATASRRLPLSEYRRYVINHEMGHWFGLAHRECPGPGAVAPVMLQQTISLDGCRPRTWPLPQERRRAAQHTGVGTR